ncbi:FecR domain-containing protein [Chitinophaga sp.]|uniref:FecR family protein n=1 Tax=Chitinophaga sp. TaxID=1869181 RepID=UPI0031CE844B
MENNNIEELFKKYIEETITEQELSRLYDFFQRKELQDEQDALLMNFFSTDSSVSSSLDKRSEIIKDAAWHSIQEKLGITHTPKYKRIYWWKRVAAAAGILLVLSSGFYFYKEFSRPSTSQFANLDILPGTNRATLVASNGAVYQLNGAKEEIVVDKGSIHYKDGDMLPVKESIQHVTLNIPRGGQYRVTLSDGTRVWLNAASSLSYPTAFTGKERSVTLKGEAYFEVAHNANQPFIVHTPDEDVKVLGTSFNVNCYNDENGTVTTLATGSVRLDSRDAAHTTELHPGEQAVLLDNTTFNVAAVDVSLYTAWKDGDFRFKATPLTEVMRQIGRWYDLDVDYASIPADIKVHASIRRDKKLSTVLHALERIGDIKFEVKGKNISIIH